VIENLSRRGTADAYPAPLRNAPNAALLIDFDNVTMGVRSDLQLQLKRLLNSEIFKGKISVQRAYADWRRYPQYIVPLSEASIDLIFAPAFGSNKKNATDIRLAIDALELVFTRPEIGTYILLSGDSDFSSLVLKLKEYGKYVIGVGIRESSSDLLIQNCDEYFSYNELTGLLKEGEVEQRRRDPWELVVAAVTRMQQGEDVMRSDRLKQVMQELDPTFSEKDAGFSKYSKFLQEAARRGLLRLNKLDNGQYEIALGGNANVPPDVEQAARESASEAERSRPPRRGGRAGRGGRSPGAGPEPAAAAGEGLSLGEAFDLLQRALADIGAVGDESTDADQTRERMEEFSEGPDPLFESRRFHRFLRQAHDAGLIDLVKSEDGAYLLRLRPRPAAEAGDEPEEDVGGDDEGRGRRRRGERGGRSRRGRRGRDEGPPTAQDHGRESVVGVPDARAAGSASRAAESPATTADRPSARNPRFRRGSRGAGGSPGSAPARPTEPAGASAADVPVAGPVSHNRSLRGRGGRRGAPGGRDAPAEPAGGQPRRDAVAGPPAARERTPLPPPAPAEPIPTPPPGGRMAEPDGADAARQESGGLFKRMSAALQRAMLGQSKGEPPRED
jgi:uncharacterized protein (TIGR00288 family)